MITLNLPLSDQLQEAFPLVENNYSFCAPDLHTGNVKSRSTKAFYIGKTDQSHPARAALLCQNVRFVLHLDCRRQAKALEYRQLPDGTRSLEDCVGFIRQTCGIQSRAELDHNDTERTMLERIVADNQRWERQQRMLDQIAGEMA